VYKPSKMGKPSGKKAKPMYESYQSK